MARCAARPCDKLEVKGRDGSRQASGTTSILLLRVGEADQGVVGLHQTGIPGEIQPSLSARLMGLDSLGVSSYLLTAYSPAPSLPMTRWESWTTSKSGSTTTIRIESPRDLIGIRHLVDGDRILEASQVVP